MSASPAGRLSFLDRRLTLWIFAAMAAAVALGRFAPQVAESPTAWSAGTTSVPIATGLILMTYPPLAKMRHEGLPDVFCDKRVLGFLPVQNGLVGPVSPRSARSRWGPCFSPSW